MGIGACMFDSRKDFGFEEITEGEKELGRG